MTIYAIGDIHGHRDKLEGVIDLIDRDGGAQAQTVFIGDYVDRGPDSRGVIDLILAGQGGGRDWIALCGNHDRLFLNYLDRGATHDARVKSGVSWLHERLGGIATLASYGVDAHADMTGADLAAAARAAVPQAHRDFLRDLPLWHAAPGHLFVHAGIRPGVALADQSEDDLCWIRHEFLNDPRTHPWLVVHGHTALDAATHHGNHVNLDSGAGYGRPISAAVFEDDACWLLTENGRLPLRP